MSRSPVETDSSLRIAVLLTCFNRRDETLACLDRIRTQQEGPADVLEVFLVDDGSTDGTSAAVAAAYPEVTIVRGDGSLYWCRGMALAFETVRDVVRRGERRFSHLLMLNDDTVLRPEALVQLIAVERSAGDRPVIVVGLVGDPDTGALTYGGFVRSAPVSPMGLSLRPVGDDRPLVAMNGNCVLVPWRVAEQTGLVDPVFHHRFGDLDLGLRAVEGGVELRSTDAIVGTCTKNPHAEVAAHARSLTFRQWVRHLLSPKGLQAADWWTFSRRHGGPFWPFFWARAYLLALLRWPAARLPGRTSG